MKLLDLSRGRAAPRRMTREGVFCTPLVRMPAPERVGLIPVLSERCVDCRGLDLGSDSDPHAGLAVGKLRPTAGSEGAHIHLASVDPNVKLPASAPIGSTDSSLYQPGIARLLPGGRPTAVLGRVIAVVVDAVERVGSRGARAHVGEERHEVVAPALAYLDAAAAVAREIRAVRPATAADHAVPDLVFGMRKRAPGPSPQFLGHGRLHTCRGQDKYSKEFYQIPIIKRMKACWFPNSADRM